MGGDRRGLTLYWNKMDEMEAHIDVLVIRMCCLRIRSIEWFLD